MSYNTADIEDLQCSFSFGIFLQSAFPQKKANFFSPSVFFS